MSRYMLLLYADEVDPAAEASRRAELPAFVELHRNLADAGLLVAVQPLRSVDSATSVRVRDAEPEIVDGPFATTKESLVGYYVLDCADLDEALRHAARVPLARYGTVEVRPVMPAAEWVSLARIAGAEVPAGATDHMW
jgi:hypothetical protein